MNSGELIAWHQPTGEPVRLTWSNGTITALERASIAPPQDLWLAPPIVDLQVNGYAGVDFQQDNLSMDNLLGAVRGLRAAGCSRFLLTLVTDEWSKLLARLRRLRDLRQAHPELEAAIIGWHIEGPFLSAEPGFCGAHSAKWMIDPTPEHIRELRESAGPDPLMLTLAPERQNAVAAIEQATACGMKVSLGHTNASTKRLKQAIHYGAIAFTHLGNGCPRELDRHDNILWRLLELQGLKVSLIPDAIHVSPTLFRLIHKEVGPENVFYVSDAMAAAGAPPGLYRLGNLQLEVGEDEIVRLPGLANFAGSALKPIDGVARASEMLACSWRAVWPRFSEAPANLMNIDVTLHVGQRADFCLLEVTPENQLVDLKVCASGEMG
jgi:N-acetylglucosamine-6-phosphate deacetylase